mmetsp:Transcript_27618/g.31632  ORF Transcript_27618/g.31632 Transcript_27618/m.31632 type:complete len:241 (+) Transcript_27618:220-942(+)
MIVTTTTKQYEARIQRHAFVVQQKVRFLIAFTAAVLLLCIENVKAFTAPFSNPDTMLFLASGAHSMARRWKAKPTPFVIHQHQQNQKTSENKEEYMNRASNSRLLFRSQRNSLTSLMAFGFGVYPKQSSAPQMLDMKTSINAFGSWYNKMDPVARPPEYDDDETDYTFSNPADSWPSSFEEDSATSTASYSTSPRATNKSSSLSKGRITRPIKTIRKIAGWVFERSPVRHARGFGTQSII